MTLQAPKPKTYLYKEVNKGRYKETRHFNLIENINEVHKPSKKLNISKNRNFARSKPLFWLKTHDGKKWNTPCLTGLFETRNTNIFYGDIDKRKHLLVFVFNTEKDTLKLFLFKNYYTKNLEQIELLITK